MPNVKTVGEGLETHRELTKLVFLCAQFVGGIKDPLLASHNVKTVDEELQKCVLLGASFAVLTKNLCHASLPATRGPRARAVGP